MEQREQSVRVVCPNCGTTLSVKNMTGGAERNIICPKCQTPINVNFAAAEPPAPLAPPAPAPVPPVASEQPERGGKSKAWLIGLLSALVLALAGVLVWLLVFKNKPAPQVDDSEEPESVSAEVSNVVSVSSEAGMEEVPVKLQVLNVEYDRSLAPQAGNTYYARNMLDGNRNTAWAVRLDDDDVYDYDALLGPTFTVECKKLAYIIIRNGYCKSEKAYRNNTRAAQISFVNQEYSGDLTNWDNGGEALLYQGRLQDTMEPQRLDIPENKSCNNDVRRIQMIFDGDYNSYYHGAKWNDLCISEVEFWGYE